MFRLQMLILMEIAALTGMFTRIIVRFPYLWRDTLHMSNALVHNAAVRRGSQVPAATAAFGIRWQVSQPTSLYNIVVEMSTASGIQYQGNTFHQSR